MRIMLTNDDGIDAPGLAVRALDRRDDCRIPLAQVRIVDAVN